VYTKSTVFYSLSVWNKFGSASRHFEERVVVVEPPIIMVK